MLPDADTYDDLRSRFAWKLGRHYNIAADVCDRWARAEPERDAILHRHEDGRIETYSYDRLMRCSNRLANALKEHGVARGDRVALLLPQMPETAISHLAIYKLAAIAVPLAALFGVEALRYRLANSGAKAVLTDRAGLAKLAEIRADLPDLRLLVSTDGPEDGAVGFKGLIDGGSESLEVEDTLADDPAMMIYTSGTTGPPKGALHGHRVLPGHLPGIRMAHEFMPREGDLFWTPADWAWAGGLLNALLPALHFGVPIVSYRFDKFDPERAFTLMAELGVKNAFIPPTALKMLRTVEAPLEKYDLNLRTIGSAGEALGRETFDWAKSCLKLSVNEFYGQTECNAVLASCAALGVSRAGAIGKPVPGHDVSIVDSSGRELGDGELGQIAVRSPDPVMFLEYWGRPDATREKFAGGFLLTGDQGFRDEDGYFHFVGRDDDVITSAGYRIGPAEIEDCLISHPAVALAAAVGKPDPVRTEIVKAYIVPKEGVLPSSELEGEIREFVRTRLSAHEYPREIAFVDTMPMTTTGKVIRRVLRDRARIEAGTDEE